MTKKDFITSAMEICGAICIVLGIASFSVPVSVIIAGVLLIIGGGLAG